MQFHARIHVILIKMLILILYIYILGENGGPAEPKRPKQSFPVHGVSGRFLPQRGHAEDVSVSVLFISYYIVILVVIVIIVKPFSALGNISNVSDDMHSFQKRCLVLKPCLNRNLRQLRADQISHKGSFSSFLFFV